MTFANKQLSSIQLRITSSRVNAIVYKTTHSI